MLLHQATRAQNPANSIAQSIYRSKSPDFPLPPFGSFLSYEFFSRISRTPLADRVPCQRPLAYQEARLAPVQLEPVQGAVPVRPDQQTKSNPSLELNTFQIPLQVGPSTSAQRQQSPSNNKTNLLYCAITKTIKSSQCK